jgi:SOS-response transcriptional repressor LexA
MDKDIHQNSRESYKDFRGAKQNSYRARIWNMYHDAGRPLTDREIMQTLQETDPNNVRPEITRLKQDGLIIEVGKSKCPFTRKTVRLATVTEIPYFNRHEKPEIPQVQLQLAF